MELRDRQLRMSLWRHFYDRERTVAELTASMAEWQEKWHWDLLKINPPACYHALDWGAEYDFFTDGVTEPKQKRAIVHGASDVALLRSPDPFGGTLGQQLEVIRNLRSRFGPDLPILETVFSPIEVAHRLMKGRVEFNNFRRQEPQAAHDLLGKIMETFRSFCLACLEAGATGIFFATKWATEDQMTWEEYVEFGKKYETPILEALLARDAWIILHVCGERTYLNRMSDYPIHIFSYDFFAEGVPSPEDLAASTGKYVMGGISPERLITDLSSALQDCSRLRRIPKWIAGGSCVLPVNIPDEAIRVLKKELFT